MASSQEQALSLLMQRLHLLQLQRASFGDKSTLVSRTRIFAAVQPCVCTLKVGRAARAAL